MFESIINPIFEPLLKLPILWAIIMISLLLALFMTLVYKWMTDQHLMKTLKEDIKKFQQQMREFKSDPKKVMEIQKRAMQTNMKYMAHSMKPTLITFIPIIIIFGWLHAHLAYEPIMPGQEFTTNVLFKEGTAGSVELIVPEQLTLLTNTTQQITDNKASWQLKGPEGEYLLEYVFNDQTFSKDLLITDKQDYKEPIKKISDSQISTITIDYKKMVPLNIFGWKVGWLGTYIIFSIVFSMSLRKILKIH
ncbi:DUF106 domain-containing protein [Candidatus Woesearchaeota archaeon]|nr:DUF106 domain-containing protein [Candidatus Woesearchaeota archaeon]